MITWISLLIISYCLCELFKECALKKEASCGILNVFAATVFIYSRDQETNYASKTPAEFAGAGSGSIINPGRECISYSKNACKWQQNPPVEAEPVNKC